MPMNKHLHVQVNVKVNRIIRISRSSITLLRIFTASLSMLALVDIHTDLVIDLPANASTHSYTTINTKMNVYITSSNLMVLRVLNVT